MSTTSIPSRRSQGSAQPPPPRNDASVASGYSRKARRSAIEASDGNSYAGSRQHSRSSRSRDPDTHSVRSGVPPPPPRSVRSGSQRRFDPDGLSHEYGADDPDGLHYAPGIRNHTQPSVRGPPSVASRSMMDEQSAMQSMASSRGSRSYYEEGTMQDGNSYYSESIGSRQSTMMSGRGLSAEASQFSNGDEDSYYSKSTRGSKSMVSSKKVR